MMYPSRKLSVSGGALQQYLLLHSQREALEQELKYDTASRSKASALDIKMSQATDSLRIEEQG
jgi:hypothetical protein